MRHSLARLVGLLVLSTSLAAQAPSFEVASVRRTPSDETRSIGGALSPGGRLDVVNVSLKEILQSAYRVRESQVINAPDWTSRERFNISARMGGDPPMEPSTVNRAWEMMRMLLADRFKAVVREEMRDMPVYHLVLASADGKLGPQLRPSDAACAAASKQPPGPIRSDAPPPCGVMRGRPGGGGVSGRGIPMGGLLGIVSNSVGRPVIDRTGLTGVFDIELQWQADLQPPAPDAASSPSMFAALQEQLGIKLEPATGPLRVIVVDSIERPSEN